MGFIPINILHFLLFLPIWYMTQLFNYILESIHTLFSLSEGSAKLKIIRGRSKIEVFDDMRPSHFLTNFHKFCDPYVILKSNCMFYCVRNRHEADFVLIPGNIRKDYGPLKAPFLFMTLFDQATHVITVSWKDVNTVANRLGPDLQSNMLFILNTGRCGSTLLGQLLTKVHGPRVSCLSEPGFVMELHRRKHLFQRQQFDLILSSALKIISYEENADDHLCKWICVKIRMPGIALGADLQRLFPNSVRLLFLHRNAWNTILSYQVFRAICFSHFTRLLLFLQHSWFLVGLYPMAKLQRSIELENAYRVCGFGSSFLEVSIGTWAWSQLQIREVENELGASMPKILYEEMLADPNGVLKTINDRMGLQSQPLTPGQLREVMERDSQENTPFEKTNVKKKYRKDDASSMTDAEIRRIRKFCSVLQLPDCM